VHEERRPSLPEIDKSGAFTISTLSYYDQPSSPVHLLATALSAYLPGSVILHSLLPPLRSMLRHLPSLVSVTLTSSFRSQNPSVHTTSRELEDVGHASYENRWCSTFQVARLNLGYHPATGTGGYHRLKYLVLVGCRRPFNIVIIHPFMFSF